MKFFTKEAFIIKTSKNEQDFFTFLNSKCEKLSLFSQDTKGIFFKRTKKHIVWIAGMSIVRNVQYVDMNLLQQKVM